MILIKPLWYAHIRSYGCHSKSVRTDVKVDTKRYRFQFMRTKISFHALLHCLMTISIKLE